jgi:hypothetical protein
MHFKSRSPAVAPIRKAGSAPATRADPRLDFCPKRIPSGVGCCASELNPSRRLSSARNTRLPRRSSFQVRPKGLTKTGLEQHRDLYLELLQTNGLCLRCKAAPAGSAGLCICCYMDDVADEAP